MRVDHTIPTEVARLFERVGAEQDGRLDILVNDIWGGRSADRLGQAVLGDSARGRAHADRPAIKTHIITSYHAAPLMVARRGGLILEITDGDRPASTAAASSTTSRRPRPSGSPSPRPRSFAPHGVTALARHAWASCARRRCSTTSASTEANWRDAKERTPTSSPRRRPLFVGRAVAALAGDPDVLRRTGQATSSWQLAAEFGFCDRDGSRPDWGAHFAEHFGDRA